jgi:aspartyl protease family protein
MTFWVALLLIAIAVIAVFSDGGITMWGLDAEHFATLAGGTGLALLLGSALGRAYRGRTGEALKAVASWLLIGLGLLAAYNYRYEIGQIGYRIAGELGNQPPAQTVEQSPTTGERSVRIRRRGDGHFIATITVNGASVQMLVDTGASTVVLKQADARKLGIDTSRLRYTVPVQTANGIAYAAHVRLRTAAVGPISVQNIDALVAQPGVLKESLLGMTFLSRLRSYEFAGNFLTFRN